MIQAFSFPIETPPGFAWAQERIARLEGEHRSPIALEAARILVARREPWGIGKPGRFHVAVARRDDVDESASFVDVAVAGAPVRFTLNATRQWTEQLRDSAAPALLALACVMAAATAFGAVTSGRASVPDARESALAQTPRDDRTARMLDDLRVVRGAFANGYTIKSIVWTQDAVLVETSSSPMDAAPVALGKFVSLVDSGATGTKTWRLARGAQP